MMMNNSFVIIYSNTGRCITDAQFMFDLHNERSSVSLPSSIMFLERMPIKLGSSLSTFGEFSFFLLYFYTSSKLNSGAIVTVTKTSLVTWTASLVPGGITVGKICDVALLTIIVPTETTGMRMVLIATALGIKLAANGKPTTGGAAGTRVPRVKVRVVVVSTGALIKSVSTGLRAVLDGGGLVGLVGRVRLARFVLASIWLPNPGIAPEVRLKGIR